MAQEVGQSTSSPETAGSRTPSPTNRHLGAKTQGSRQDTEAQGATARLKPSLLFFIPELSDTQVYEP